MPLWSLAALKGYSAGSEPARHSALQQVETNDTLSIAADATSATTQ
jgi:hypothetical protein